MEQKMRAVVYLGPEKIELQTVPIPEPASGEILVKVRAATTCGTDVKTYRRGHPKFPPPFIFGHEFGGDVVKVGEGVEQFREGMRVTANVFAECGECFFCQRGQGNLCENLVYNFGAFAEYMIIPAPIVRRTAFEIPAHISPMLMRLCWSRWSQWCMDGIRWASAGGNSGNRRRGWTDQPYVSATGTTLRSESGHRNWSQPNEVGDCKSARRNSSGERQREGHGHSRS